jgi:uncharacterized membrane protein YeaQ/YmgE (transglycosylase-associated protein family)
MLHVQWEVAVGIIAWIVLGAIAGFITTGVNIESIVVAVVGAIIVVAVYRMVTGRRTAV